MNVFPVPEIDGLLIIEPRVFTDDRGLFYESFNTQLLELLGHQFSFVQDNHSVSKKNVVRGLHFQSPPYDQGKLVRVVAGAALDVAVDIRKSSPTYGKHFSILLNGDDHRMFWIPPGFAHGFASLEDNTVFLYKCTAPYHRDSESGTLYNDPDLAIDWIVNEPIVSPKDLILGSFEDLKSPF